MAQAPLIFTQTTGAEFVAFSEAALQALASTSKAGTRPQNAAPGQFWIDDSNVAQWLLKCFDGTQDVLVATIDPSSHTITPNSAGLPLGNAANKNTGTSGDTIPKNDTANTFSGLQRIQAAAGLQNGLSIGSSTAGGHDFRILQKRVGELTITDETASVEIASVKDGLVVGAPTGGDQGASTVNATQYFRDGIAFVDALLVDFISGHFELPVNKSYFLDQQAPFAYEVQSLTTRTGFGSCTVALKIDGVNVTGISGLASSTTEAAATATAANVMAVGSDLALAVSAVANARDLRFTVKIRRIL